MSKEQLIQEAYKRYPPGTIFYAPHLYTNQEFKVLEGCTFDTHLNYGGGKDLVCFIDNDVLYNENGYSGVIYCHYNKKWAEIVSTPILKYEIY